MAACFTLWEEAGYFSAITSSNIEIHEVMMSEGWKKNLRRPEILQQKMEEKAAVVIRTCITISLSFHCSGKQ